MSVHLITPQEAFLKDAPTPETRSLGASAQQETADPKALSKAISSAKPLSTRHFDAIIDVRSEDEFALDHWPGAVNWPVLNNAERVTVGTLYKQVSAFEAQKKGAAMVAANIARHIEAHVMDLPKSWQPLLYCWRGGKRSGSISGVLSQIGFRVHLLEGGY